MGGHALRGAVVAWMGLIVLRTVGAAAPTGKITSLFSDVDGFLQRVISQDVPAIPDHGTKASGTHSYITPAQAAAAARAGHGGQAVGALTAPGGALDGMPSLNQYVNGGGLHFPAGWTPTP
jgi:hypothetical protein